MATLTQEKTRSDQDLTVEQKVQKLRALYADAPELGKVALEKGLADLRREMAAPPRRENAGRLGARQGQVSEFTLIFPFRDGGAKRLRGLLQLTQGNFQL